MGREIKNFNCFRPIRGTAMQTPFNIFFIGVAFVFLGTAGIVRSVVIKHSRG
jgi:hypothetical protein